ncbi:MAG TPA: XdhC family protein [Anaeromyxobacter sp.]
MKKDLLARVLADVAAKKAVVVATDLASGEAFLLHPFEPGSGVDPAVAEAAREAAERDESTKVERPGGAVFLRVFNPPVQVIIIGAVHIAQSLAPMVKLAGYEPVVVDPRRAFATEARFEGVPLVREWPDEALARLGLGRRTALVTMTHDPKIDDPALAAALRSDAFYVGSLGSKKTQAARRERLGAMGFSGAALDRIKGPVGLSIGARSPGEIAVSILSQLVHALRVPAGARASAA